MLDFIKRLLGKKEKIGLTLESVEEWFDKKTKSSYEARNNRVAGIKTSISEEVSKIKENIKSLENAELKNKDIPLKEKQFMEGNRSFYIKRINFFIESIKIPEDNIKSFIERMNIEIDALGKSTLKAYQILQHFFRDETYLIAQNIKNIDNYFKELKEALSDKRIKAIERIKEDTKLLKENIEKEKESKKRLENRESKIRELEKERKSILSEISHKEQSQDYKEYHRLEVEKYKINEQVEELKDEIIQYFSILEHSIKKHTKLNPEDESLLNKYIEDPIKALISDYKLDIKRVLEKLEENIFSKKIDLKDKKKEKTLQVLSRINEAKLASFLTEYNQFMVELRSIEERMGSNKIMSEIEDIKTKLNNKNQEVESMVKKVEDLKKYLSQIDIKADKDKIRDKISSLLEIELDLD